MFRFLAFRRGPPADVTGPEVAIHPTDIVAVAQDNFDTEMNRWRSAIHLRGGSVVHVAESYDAVVSALEKWRTLAHS